MFPEIDQVTNCTINAIKDFAVIDENNELYDGFIYNLKQIMKKYKVKLIEGRIIYNQEYDTLLADNVHFEGMQDNVDYAVLVKTNKQIEELKEANNIVE